mmetsp:Transcript_7853/g.25637  ORF Transcript_7853/g.25637 Transcript_7853/m.25637 type:complete len:211 (+) Transcript_7853:967-1599(+)
MGSTPPTSAKSLRFTSEWNVMFVMACSAAHWTDSVTRAPWNDSGGFGGVAAPSPPLPRLSGGGSAFRRRSQSAPSAFSAANTMRCAGTSATAATTRQAWLSTAGCRATVMHWRRTGMPLAATTAALAGPSAKHTCANANKAGPASRDATSPLRRQRETSAASFSLLLKTCSECTIARVARSTMPTRNCGTPAMINLSCWACGAATATLRA